MALCFSPEKFATHQAGAIQKMQVLGLDGLLMFKQESMFFRARYGTFGFVFSSACIWAPAVGSCY